MYLLSVRLKIYSFHYEINCEVYNLPLHAYQLLNRALSLLLAPCLGVFQASLQIEEAGVRYNQTEIFDPLTSDVITLVPGHHRDGIYLHQLAKVENEDLGLVVWKLADKEVCHIEDMDAEDLRAVAVSMLIR